VHPSKRTWIYAGLGLPAQVGVVRPSRPSIAAQRLQRGSKLLLVGDQSVRGLAPPLQQLARDAGVIFHAESKPGSSAQDWAQPAWIQHLLRPRPQLVLLSVAPGPVGPLCQLAAGYGARAVWITPPLHGVRPPQSPSWGQCAVFPTYALAIPRGPDQRTPTASGYAGWAGVLWRWLRQVR
jgi:hypothetical protein